MDDIIKDAKEELKRVDHLIYVSLKYTRTVDVIKNVVDRLISSYDFITDALLKRAVDKEKIDKAPTAPMMKAEEIEKLYAKDEQILIAAKQYMLLRQISRAEYERESEYRRHVAMIVHIEGQEIKVDIDLVTEYYKQARELIEYIESKYND